MDARCQLAPWATLIASYIGSPNGPSRAKFSPATSLLPSTHEG